MATTITQIAFDEKGVGTQIIQAQDMKAGMYGLPAKFTSKVAARYKLDNGVISDTFKGTDDEFFAAQVVAEQARAIALAQTTRANKKLTPLEFYGMFTQAELGAVYTAAKVDVSAQIFLDQIQVAQDITLSDARTQYGLRALATAGLVTQDRVEAILRGELPA